MQKGGKLGLGEAGNKYSVVKIHKHLYPFDLIAAVVAS